MAADDDGAVLLRRDGAVTVLVLNRPDRLNAIDEEVATGLRDGLATVGDDDSCRCLVITGNGRGFCSGQALPKSDTTELPPNLGNLVRERYTTIVTLIRGLTIPVIAAVNGVAAGAGFGLALSADLRVASDDAWFTCGFAGIGLVPDTGVSFFLPQYIGYPRALQLALTGERLSSEMAVGLGLVTNVYPTATFTTDYMSFAKLLAAGPTRAFALTKQGLQNASEATLDEQLELEAQLQQRASETADFKEGLRAFRERRQPQFRGL